MNRILIKNVFIFVGIHSTCLLCAKLLGGQLATEVGEPLVALTRAGDYLEYTAASIFDFANKFNHFHFEHRYTVFTPSTHDTHCKRCYEP